MKFNIFFLFLFAVLQLNAQDFATGPYQALAFDSPIVADFNGDSLVDVLGIDYTGASNRVVLQINNGSSPTSFTSKNLNIDLLDATGLPDVGDFDGDNDIDVVIAKNSSALELYILVNDGAANFTIDTLGVSGSRQLKVVDFDNDSDLDIIGLNATNKTINLYRNDGNENFTKKVLLTSTSSLELFAVADMDNDSDFDIVLGYNQFTGKQITVYKNNGNDSFSEVLVVSNDFSSVESLVIDDMNNDGKMDILASRAFTAAVFLNQGGLSFLRQDLPSAGLLRSIQTGDYNGDGKRDYVLGSNSSDTKWYKNISNAPLAFNSGNVVGSISPCFTILNGDLDNDKDEDLVVFNGEFWWYENLIVQLVRTLDFAENEVRIFPNPFKNTIQLRDLAQYSYDIKIVDVLGRVVYSAFGISDLIDLSQLEAGTYFATLTNETTNEVRSVVLVKEK